MRNQLIMIAFHSKVIKGSLYLSIDVVVSVGSVTTCCDDASDHNL